MCVVTGADSIRHRALRGVVRGVHGELRARDAAPRRARLRAAQPQDARRVAAGMSTYTCTHTYSRYHMNI